MRQSRRDDIRGAHAAYCLPVTVVTAKQSERARF
jgi:hypothetical protein